MAFITEWNMPAGIFYLPTRSGYTYNADIDYGDGTIVHISSYNDAGTTHNYAVAGTYQISITGTFGAWYINGAGSIKDKITKVIDWGNVSFDSWGLYGGFKGCGNLILLPSSPITGATLVSNFTDTFKNTGISVIPSGFFNNTAANNLTGCFSNTKIVEIPNGLFDAKPGITNFQSTFSDNQNLAGIPDGLFRYINHGYVDYSFCFANCPKLQINPYTFYLPSEKATRFLNSGPNFQNTFNRSTFSGIPGVAPDLWNCNFGTGTPIKTNCFAGLGNNTTSITNYADIPNAWGAVHPKINTLTAIQKDSSSITISLVLRTALPGTDSLKCYCSNVLAGLTNTANLITLTTVDNLNFTATKAVNDGEYYYIEVDYYTNGTNTENKAINGLFNSVVQKSTTIINIVAPNWKTLSDPRIPLVHGTIIVNDYFYGSSRGSWNGTDSGASFFKVSTSDYSIFLTKTFYLNKTNSTSQFVNIDQVVYASGFLWALSGGYLIRINPNDLDYMVFDTIGVTNMGQPIGTDGTYLFITTNTSIFKINVALLIGTFTSYGYTGTPVTFPTTAILGSCLIIQKHTTINAFSHSIAIDNQFIYLAVTTSSQSDGFVDSINLFHLQKIDKNTMISSGDVSIPKCTDDMVQSADYIYLAPELSTTSIALFGSSFGLVAIKKSTLELKYLKALHQDFNSENENDRQCYGVFFYNNYIIVQLVTSKKSVVINTSDVENWGQSFPIGGATEAVYKFQREGIDILLPPNELVIDNNNWVHISTWGNPGDLMKFPLNSLYPGIQKNPVIQTALISQNNFDTTVGGYIIDEGKSPITSGGFKWGTDPEALTNDLPADPFSYDFQDIIANLAPGVYYAQAYGTNTEGTFYGNTVMFSVVAHYNAVSLHNDDTIALLEFIDTHFGCSIRCVQDAPGVTDGTTGTATDQDGNVYDTVVINEKRWMVQNLKTKKYRNGEAIPEVSDAGTWAGLSSGGYCNVN